MAGIVVDPEMFAKPQIAGAHRLKPVEQLQKFGGVLHGPERLGLKS